jgi:hypothetical protein
VVRDGSEAADPDVAQPAERHLEQDGPVVPPADGRGRGDGDVEVGCADEPLARGDERATRWACLYRAIDQFGQVIDVLAAERPGPGRGPPFFTRALAHGCGPVQATTDRAPAYPRVLDEPLPAAHHVDARYANNSIEADHGRLKARLRPMRGLKRLRSAQIVGSAHALIQNIRRGHYELGIDAEPRGRLAAAFTELALAL